MSSAVPTRSAAPRAQAKDLRAGRWGRSLTVGELAQKVGATVRGDKSLCLQGCAALETAGPREVSFLSNRKYVNDLRRTKAGAVILAANDVKLAVKRTVLVADDPYFVFREAMVSLHGWRQHPAEGISPHAYVDPIAEVRKPCSIHPLAYIARGARIGRGCVIYPHVYVGEGTTIGQACVLYPNVTIYDGCVIGNRVTLHAGCSIGQDGMGYATHAVADDQPRHYKIPPTGNAIIEDDVEMGANCSVDRATVGSTIVGEGSKFSNGVTIGHGSRVGPHNLFVAQVGLAGSVETGAHVVLGGQAGVAGHLRIGDRAQVAATSGVMDDVPPDTMVGGTPALPMNEARRVVLRARRLPDLVARFKKLERELERLKNQV